MRASGAATQRPGRAQRRTSSSARRVERRWARAGSGGMRHDTRPLLCCLPCVLSTGKRGSRRRMSCSSRTSRCVVGVRCALVCLIGCVHPSVCACTAACQHGTKPPPPTHTHMHPCWCMCTLRCPVAWPWPCQRLAPHPASCFGGPAGVTQPHAGVNCHHCCPHCTPRLPAPPTHRRSWRPRSGSTSRARASALRVRARRARVCRVRAVSCCHAPCVAGTTRQPGSPHRASSLSPPPHTHTRARARHATTTDLRKQDLELLEAAPPDESGRGGGGRGAALMPYAKDADDADADADDDDSDSSSDVSVPVAWACACACALGTAVRRLVRARGGGDDTRAGTQVSGGAHAPSAQPRCQDTHVRQRQRHRTTAATTRRS
jgi:hypothetical protein